LTDTDTYGAAIGPLIVERGNLMQKPSINPLSKWQVATIGGSNNSNNNSNRCKTISDESENEPQH